MLVKSLFWLFIILEAYISTNMHFTTLWCCCIFILYMILLYCKTDINDWKESIIFQEVNPMQAIAVSTLSCFFFVVILNTSKITSLIFIAGTKHCLIILLIYRMQKMWEFPSRSSGCSVCCVSLNCSIAPRGSGTFCGPLLSPSRSEKTK